MGAIMDDAALAAQARRVVEAHYAFGNEGDMDRMEAQFDENVVLIEADGHPHPGRWQGKAALRDAAEGVVRALGLTDVTVIEMMNNESRVAALIRTTMTGPDGQPFTHDVVELWKVSPEGKITEIWPFYHDLLAVREQLREGV